MPKPTPEQLEQLTAEANEFMESTGRKRFPADRADALRELGAKRCPGCSTVKSLGEFSLRTRNQDGLENRCRPCHTAATLERRSTNLERSRRRGAAASKRHRINRPWVDRLRRGYLRALRAGFPAEEISQAQLLQHWESTGLDKDRSAYSGVLLTPENVSLDHVVPLSDPNSPGHVLSNLVPCTKNENASKKQRPFLVLLTNDPDPDASDLVLRALEPGAPDRHRRTLVLRIDNQL